MAKKSPQNGNKSKKSTARGGSRPNAGRKSKAAKQIDALLEQHLGPMPDLSPTTREQAALYGLGLHVQTMKGELGGDLELRLDSAREVMNRVWGKPAQAVKLSGADDGEIRIKVVYADSGTGDRPAEAPPGPG